MAAIFRDNLQDKEGVRGVARVKLRSGFVGQVEYNKTGLLLH
jgi:hypothetical protein